MYKVVYELESLVNITERPTRSQALHWVLLVYKDILSLPSQSLQYWRGDRHQSHVKIITDKENSIKWTSQSATQIHPFHI